MDNLFTWTRRCIVSLLFVAISLILIAFLTFLHAGLLPTVFADEWLYSSSARLLTLSESILPSYLFLLLFKNTNYCGLDFLTCARFANASLFVFSLPFIYAVARLVTIAPIALFIAILSLLAPIHSYTAYFMPESMYFFSFWVFVFALLKTYQRNSYVFGATIGCLLCLMSLIKMHAIFLIPSFIIFLLLSVNDRSFIHHFKKVISTIICMLSVFFLLRCMLGYIIAGHTGLNLFGIKYYHQLLSAIEPHRLILIALQISIPIIGHLSALTLLFAVPIAIMANDLFNRNKCVPINEHEKAIKLFTLASLLTLLFVTIFTTAQIVGWDPYETINRIHARYYNFLFPLFFIIASTELSKSQSPILQLKNCTFVIFILLGIFYAIYRLPNQYLISFIDCPALFGINYHATIRMLIGFLAIITTLIWLLRPRWGAYLYLLIFSPLAMLIASYFVHYELTLERLYTQDAYDRAGQFVRTYLGGETSHLTIVGHERGGLYKTLFYIDNAKTTFSELPEYTPIEFAKIPKENTWVLAIGHYPVLNKPYFQISMKDFTLIKRKA